MSAGAGEFRWVLMVVDEGWSSSLPTYSQLAWTCFPEDLEQYPETSSIVTAEVFLTHTVHS